MGAILGLCLSITIVSFINGIENHLIKAKAETIDTKSDIDFINQVNDITMPLNAKTLLSDEELQEQYAGVIKQLRKGYPVRMIAKSEGVGISTVQRIKKKFKIV